MHGPDPTWRRLLGGTISPDLLRRRADLLSRTRAFFRDRGFTEVDPPTFSAHPNLDPNILPVAAAVRDAGGRTTDGWLHTSPELSMKKLLAAGSGNIFFLGKVFRDVEGSPLHRNEFVLLEWYRVGEPVDAVMRDVEDLVREIGIDLSSPFPRRSLPDLFRDLLDADVHDEASVRAALDAKGLRPESGDDREALFFRAMVDVVEPALAKEPAVFVDGYPAWLGAMARRRDDDPRLCERFEGFVRGVELVNGYGELTDATEQAERLRAVAADHLAKTGRSLPIDPDFIDALRRGLPPCSGAALGFDRIAMLAFGSDDIADVTIF